ncbi:hypothetical protein PPUJ20066_33170 [Pseudomonas putida]|nr:hypothetical protein PPUJ20066_33170 [Pseudomonas putida]
MRGTARQADNLALQPQRAAIQFRRESIIQRSLGRPARPAQAQQKPAYWPKPREQAGNTTDKQQK